MAQKRGGRRRKQKMKIAIMTFPNSKSIGASLQMYSLYKVLTDMGHAVEVLNYNPPNLHGQLTAPAKKGTQKVKEKIKTMLIHCIVPSSGKAFARFERKIHKFPETPTSSTEDLKVLAERYDRFFVGSDQVWNYDVTGHDFNFYLEFCQESRKKASYAASFGYNDVCENEKTRIADLLNDFSYLSVREIQGQKIVNSLTGKNPALVLDPTLLIDEKKLKEVMIPYTRNKGYVLFYNIKQSAHLLEVAKNFAEEHNYILVKIGGRVKDRFRKDLCVEYDVGPAEFLGLVNGAEYVFTNSFHGFAISLAMERNVYVEYSTDTNSRLTNMVDVFELEKNVVLQNTDRVEAIEIGYAKINKKLHELRDQSMSFVYEATQE